MENLEELLAQLSLEKVETNSPCKQELEKATVTQKQKGAGCSVSGKKYELQVHSIVTKCKLNGKLFNTQTPEELGGCSSNNDIECNFNNEKDISIEIKKYNTPDWMQCSLQYDKEEKNWRGGSRNKIPNNSKKIFEDLLSGIVLFNGKTPPFLERDLTHSEWIQIKKESKDFNDVYINCPNDTIKKLYNEKGCSYIQISEKGLYHLGNDICDFKVPEFICEQHLRIRTKVHTKKDKNGFCKLSIMVACKPKNNVEFPETKFSLDDEKKIPDNFVYIN